MTNFFELMKLLFKAPLIAFVLLLTLFLQPDSGSVRSS
jgi:hypothetical protein